MAYLNLTKDLTKAGIRKIKVGEMLIFDYEGSPVYLEIMRKTKEGVWAKKLDPEFVLTPDEADQKVTVVPKS